MSFTPTDAQAGKTVTATVTVTYSDKSTDTATVTFKVAAKTEPEPKPEPTDPKADLRKEVESASKLDEKDYTADSWKAYSDALKAAKAKLVNGTTDSVAAALTALTAAENALVRTTTPPDTTVLDETIADMEKVNGSEYTTDSYKALTDAIAKAKSDKVKGDAASTSRTSTP